MERGEVAGAVRSHLIDEVLDPADAETLTDQTALLSSGILDSMSTAMLVAFLEERYGIEVEGHEMGVDNFETVTAIVDLVSTKFESAS